MRNRQQGMTAIGMLIMLLILGMAGFAGIRLAPMYLENFKIVKLLEDVKGELDGQNASISAIRKAIDKRLNVEDIKALKVKDFKISRGPAGFIVQAKYDGRAPYIGNVILLAEFDRQVEIVR